MKDNDEDGDGVGGEKRGSMIVQERCEKYIFIAHDIIQDKRPRNPDPAPPSVSFLHDHHHQQTLVNPPIFALNDSTLFTQFSVPNHLNSHFSLFPELSIPVQLALNSPCVLSSPRSDTRSSTGMPSSRSIVSKWCVIVSIKILI